MQIGGKFWEKSPITVVFRSVGQNRPVGRSSKIDRDRPTSTDREHYYKHIQEEVPKTPYACEFSLNMNSLTNHKFEAFHFAWVVILIHFTIACSERKRGLTFTLTLVHTKRFFGHFPLFHFGECWWSALVKVAERLLTFNSIPTFTIRK